MEDAPLVAAAARALRSKKFDIVKKEILYRPSDLDANKLIRTFRLVESHVFSGFF